VSKLKIAVLVAFLIALIAFAASGGGWKWRHAQAAPQEHVAGWTWEMRAAKHE
jgi:hypothetical protein